MRNTNRLIDDFKRLTKDTVWKHLDAMAVNYAVYSTPLNQLFPLLRDFDVYLYCNDTNMVVVCLESCGHGKAQTYEESETLSPLIFSPGCEPRVSVVWKLAETVRQIEKCLHDARKSINVHGVLLTEADITNSYELSRMWAADNITVIDNLRRLKHKLIKVNIDCDLACKTYIDILLDASLNNIDEPADPKPRNATNSGISLFGFDYEEFEKTVRDFIKRESDGNAEENEVEEQQGQSTDECEEECAEEEDEETPSTDQTIFPDGEIEQNLNVSVKVEILRPIPNPREELDRRVDLHMAAVGLPPDCTKYASEVTRLAKLRARQIAAAGNAVDIADIVGKAIDTLKTAFVNAVGDEEPKNRLADPGDRLAKRVDQRLADFAGRHLRMFAVGANHRLRSDEEVADLVRLTAQFYAYANKKTSSLLSDRRDIAFGSPQYIAYKRDYASAALKFMDTVGRPLAKNHFKPIRAYVGSISNAIEMKSRELTSYGTSFTEAKVRELVDEVERQIQGLIITNARDEPLFGSDDKANRALARYVGRLISLSLPDDTYDAIRTHLHVESVTGMFAQMAYVGIYQSVHGVRPAVSAI